MDSHPAHGALHIVRGVLYGHDVYGVHPIDLRPFLLSALFKDVPPRFSQRGRKFG